MGVRFYLRRAAGSGESRPAALILSILWNRDRRLLFTTPHRIAPRDWSGAFGRVKPSVPGAVELNGALLRLRAFAESLVATDLSDDEVRAAVAARMGKMPAPVAGPRLAEAFDRWTDHKRPMLRPSTLQTYAALRGHLVSIYGEGAPLSTISGAFLDGLQSALTSRGLGNGTVNNLVICARGFITWASEAYGVEVRTKAKALPTSTKVPLYLTRAELARLAELDLSEHPPGYGAARDLFLAEAVTGQRYGDVKAMTWAQLDMETWTWHLVTQKTGLPVEVAISAPLRRLIEARKGEPTPLPALSNQSANVFIKEVCRLAEIDTPVSTQSLRGGERDRETRPKWQAVTTHVARKTFATLFEHGGGQRADLIGLTHEDYATMDVYIGRNTERQREVVMRTFADL